MSKARDLAAFAKNIDTSGNVDPNGLNAVVPVAKGGTGASDSGTARSNLGLGSMATQSSSSVSITGGSISGISDLAVADGGTGASDAGTARNNLGLGSMATQSSSSVSITGGSISGITDLPIADGGTGASTAANARTNLDVPSRSGSGASGTWPINITGSTGKGGGNIASNLANGTEALLSNTTGFNNTALGNSALRSLTNGESNVAVGQAALTSITTGDNNVAVGVGAAIYTGTDASYNTAIGRAALAYLTGNYCTAVGGQALNGASSGDGSCAFGYFALYNSTSGSYNTGIGYNALTGLTNLTNCSGLGNGTSVSGSNQVQLGNSSTTTYVYGTVGNRSDIRDKTDVRDTTLGLDFIKAVRPVDYRWDMRDDYRPDPSEAPKRPDENATPEEHEAYKKQFEVWIESNKLSNIQHDGSKKRNRYHHGIIAQELKATIDELGVDFGGFQDHSIAGGDDVLSIGYDEFVAPLIKSVQQLSAQLDAATARIAELDAQIQELKQRT